MRSDEPPAAADARAHYLEVEAHREALARLAEGLGSRAPVLLITGPGGVGKTRLVHEVVQRWGARAKPSFIDAKATTELELLENILRNFGLEPRSRATQSQLRDRLERLIREAEGSGQVPVIVVDDAQEMSSELLGELRSLVKAAALAHRPVEVVLVGPPDLEARLNAVGGGSLGLEVAVRCPIEAFSPQDTRRYLGQLATAFAAGRHSFSKKACREIFTHTKGVPHDIAPLAAAAMGLAHDAGTAVVTPAHVTSASAKLKKRPPPMRPFPATVAPAPAAPAALAPAATTEGEVTAVAAPATPVPVASEGPKPSEIEDPRVAEWVGRFIKPDEPKFAELLMAPPPREHGEVDWTPDEARAGGEAGAVRVGARGRSRSRSGRPAPGRRPASGGSRERQLIAVMTVLLVVMTTAVLVLLSRQKRAPGRTASVAARTEQHPAVERPRVAPAKRASPATVTPPVAAPTLAPPSAEPSPVAAPTARFALQVGTWMYRDEAESERARIVASTGLKGWLVEGTDESAGAWHLVLGTFSSAERAESSASSLLEAGTLSEARVIPLPPRRLRF